VATLRVDLIRAGFRSESAAPVFYGLRVISTAVLVMLSFLMLAKMPSNVMMKVMLLVFGAMAGWILPKFFLEKKVKKRQNILRLSLPDMLDMLVVSVEAGLGLDQAIQHVAGNLPSRTAIERRDFPGQPGNAGRQAAGRRFAEFCRADRRAGDSQADGHPDSE